MINIDFILIYLNLKIDLSCKRIVGHTALFEILMVLKREANKEKNDEIKQSHFINTLERAYQEKLKLAIIQLKCVPCLNKFTTNITLTNSSSVQSIVSQATGFNGSNKANYLLQQQQQQQQQLQQYQNSKYNSSPVNHSNMGRLLKQMANIISTELQQIAFDLIERNEADKQIKYIKLKDEFKQVQANTSSHVNASSLTTPSTSALTSSCSAYKLSATTNTPTINGLPKATSFTSRNLSNEFSNMTSTPKIPMSQTTSLLAQYQQQQNNNTNNILQAHSKFLQSTGNKTQLQVNKTGASTSNLMLTPQPSSTSSSSLSTSDVPSTNMGNKLAIMNPYANLQSLQFITDKLQDIAPIDRNTNSYLNSNRF